MIDFSNVKELSIGGKSVKELWIDGKKAWEKMDWQAPGLAFKSLEAGTTIGMSKYGNPPSTSFEYTLDNGASWNAVQLGTTISLPKGKSIGFRNTSSTTSLATWDGSLQHQHYFFTGEGKVAAYGYIDAIINKNYDTTSTTHGDRCFTGLFRNMTSLVDASKLQLPQLVNGVWCGYQFTFSGCSSMTNPPTLNETGYLNAYAYADMFSGCSSMVKAPEIKATTISTTEAVSNMFKNCSQLNEIKLTNFIGNFSSGPFGNWVYGVASTGTFYYNGSDTTRGANAIPTGWTVQSF